MKFVVVIENFVGLRYYDVSVPSPIRVLQAFQKDLLIQSMTKWNIDVTIIL